MATPSLASNVVAKTILNIFNIAVPFVVTSYVYHVLGPFDIGNVQYALSLYNYFMILGLFGIYNYALREISMERNNHSKVRTIFKNMMVWSFMSNLAALGCYILFIIFILHDPVIKTLSWILCINLLGQCFYLEWFNEAMEKFRFITIKTMAVRIASVVMTLLWVKSPADIYIYMWILVSIGLMNYVVSFIYAERQLHMGIREMFSGLKLRRYIIPLLTIMILNNSAYLFTAIDTTFLGYFVNKEQVSYFSLGNRMCEMMWTLLLSVVFATLPRLSLYLHEEKHLYEEGLLKVMRMLMFVALPCGVALWMLSPELVDFFGGPAYVEAIPVTRLFAIRLVFLSIQGVMYNQVIFLHGYERLQMILNIACGGLNVLLNFICVPFLTPVVSLLCTLFSEVIYILFNYLFITYKLKIRLGLFTGYNLRYLLLSLLCIPLIYALQLLHLNMIYTFILALVICGTLYCGILAAWRDESYMQLQRYVLRLFHRQ